MAVIFAIQWFSFLWEIIMLLCQFTSLFYKTEMKMLLLIAQLFIILLVIGMALLIVQKTFHWRMFLKSVILPLLLPNSVSGSRLELMYYNRHCKYQIKPYSSPWLTATCAAIIACRNRKYLPNKSCVSTATFRQANDLCKRVVEAAKIAFDNKAKKFYHFSKLVSCEFWWIPNGVLSKGKPGISPALFNGSGLFFNVSAKAKLFAETFS